MIRARVPFWLSEPSRYARLGRGRARALLGALALLLAASVVTTLSTPPPNPIDTAPHDHAEDRRDVLLYEQIVDEVRHGGDYYVTTARALREGNYPLKPFVTFRLPTLATVQAKLPPLAVILLRYALVVGTLAAWLARWRGTFARLPGLLIALGLLLSGLGVFLQRDLIAFHEIWAGLLIALSLALWAPDRWVACVAFGTAAMLVRETAALYVLVMAGMALIEGRRREAIGWTTGLATLALAVAAHAVAVARVVEPLDPVSPGWTGMLGLGFFLRAVTVATPLSFAPVWLGALLAMLAFVGWSAWPHPTARRVLTILVAYAALIAIAARADTFYWVLLIAPLLLPGLAFVPDGLRDLWTAATVRRRIVVRRLAR